MRPSLFEQPQHAQETGAAAVFEEVLDNATAPSDRRQPHDLRYQIVLSMGIAVQDIALASLLIVEDETDRDPRSPWPCGKWAPLPVTMKVARHCIRHPRLLNARRAGRLFGEQNIGKRAEFAAAK